ncbi:unnamed protein product [Brassica oleracea]
MEENEDLYARFDFPGVTKESLRILVEPLKKAVFVFGDAPKEFRHDSSHRKYGAVTGLVCDCCEISNIQCFVGDGVVRLILSKKKINLHFPSSCSCKLISRTNATQENLSYIVIFGKPISDILFMFCLSFLFFPCIIAYHIVSDIIHGMCADSMVAVAGGHPLGMFIHIKMLCCDLLFWTGPVTLPHPSVLEGSTSAYESKHLPNGGLFLRIDMPGVPNDRFTMTVESDGGITVIGRAPPAMHDSNGFYAVNNPFLVSGPKGFTEFKMLENEDMFIRIDFPGVPQDAIKVRIDPTKKAVSITADAPKEHKHDSSPRNYGSATGLVCKCCEISGLVSHMSDGVLRLHLSKTRASSQSPSCIYRCSTGPHTFPHGTDPHDPELTGPLLEPHPCVNIGSDMAYEWKILSNGGLYVRVDMPGVPKDRFTVSVVNGRVSVTGDAPAVGLDSGGRFYSGEVTMLESQVSIPGRKIKTIAKNGVIRLIIPPL